MTNENVVASTSQFQTLLIAFVLIVSVIYFFIEIRRFDMRVNSLEKMVKKLMNSSQTITRENTRENTDTNSITIDIPTTNNFPVKSETNIPKELVAPTDEQEAEQVAEEPETQIVMNEIEDNTEEPLPVSIVEDDTPEVKEEIDIMINRIDDESDDLDEPNDEDGASKDQVDSAVDSAVDNAADNAEVDDAVDPILDNISENTVSENTVSENTVSENNLFMISEVTEYTKYQNNTIKELKDILIDMELPTSGNKQRLIQRIVSNKNKISK